LLEFLKSKKEKLQESNSRRSYSQCGEDMIVDYIFGLRGIDHPSFIDIGANHPYYLNNTAFFYEKGCKGLNIEANPDLIDIFKEYRPNDINLNLGIDGQKGEMEFYVMEDNTLSTFSKQELDGLVASGKKMSKVMKVKLDTIPGILATYFDDKFPDFLSLDVEGMDFKILQSINFEKHFPKIICVEAAEYSSKGTGARRHDLIDFLVAKGYYEYANTNLNAILVDKKFWFI